jgi:hypothetical protein
VQSLVGVEIVVAGGVGREVADIAVERALVPGRNEADVLQPVAQDAAEIFRAGALSG